MPKRATLAELHIFANKVREAGGGNPIDALMPAVPQDSTQCLIAKNLNFNCEVKGADGYDWPRDDWVMELTDKNVRDRIAAALDLPTAERQADRWEPPVTFYAVRLPNEIGAVAQAFDDSLDVLDGLVSSLENDFCDEFGTWPDEIVMNDEQAAWLAGQTAEELKSYSEDERSDLAAMIPMILDAGAEARRIATIVNDDGSIVL